MYAIRKRKSNCWLHKINHRVPITSSKRVVLDANMPILYAHEAIARLELVENHLSQHAYEIVEVEVCQKNPIKIGESSVVGM